MADNHTIKEELVHKQVIKAAQQLFQQHGLHKVTMEDVAEAIGKAKSSLYYYYKSKEDIWEAVMDVEIAEIVAEIALAVGKANGTEEKIRAFCGTMILGLRKKRALYHIAFGAYQAIKRQQNTTAIRGRFLKQEGGMFKRILEDGVINGELKPMGQKEMDILVFVLLSGLKGLEKEIVIEEGYDPLPAINIFSHMIIHGLKC